MGLGVNFPPKRDSERGEEKTLDVNLLELFVKLRKNSVFIAVFTVAVAAAGAAVSFVVPNQYVAAMIILPPSSGSVGASALLSQFSGGVGALAGASLSAKNSGDMYVSLFHSRTVEDTVIKRFNLIDKYKAKFPSDARVEFEKRSSVSYGIKDGLIRLTYRDRDPKLAADVANGYAEAFQSLSSRIAITEASQRRLFYQKQLDSAKGDLANAEEALKETQEATGVLQIDGQTRALIESSASIRAQIVAKNVELEGLRTYASEDNPDIIKVKQQLGALQAQQAKLRGNDMMDDIFVPQNKVPEAGLEYLRRLREVKYHEAVFELIAKQLEIARIDEARQGAIFQVVDVALPPDRKSSPRRTAIVLLTAFLGLVASCCWCGLKNE